MLLKFIGIAVVVLLVSWIIATIGEEINKGTISLIGYIGILLSLVCVTVMGITYYVLDHKYATDTLYSHEFAITAMSDNDAFYIKGSRWHVDGETEMRYYFMRPWDGGKKEGWIPANNAVIYETDSETPHIECYMKNCVDPNKHPTVYKLLGEDKWGNRTNNGKEYKIYIPKGSVIEDYNIDLQ